MRRYFYLQCLIIHHKEKEKVGLCFFGLYSLQCPVFCNAFLLPNSNRWQCMPGNSFIKVRYYES